MELLSKLPDELDDTSSYSSIQTEKKKKSRGEQLPWDPA